MDTIKAIYARRAIKHFDADHKLADAEEQQLLEATIQAPTSFNIGDWWCYATPNYGQPFAKSSAMIKPR